jgi:hypothetical protein
LIEATSKYYYTILELLNAGKEDHESETSSTSTRPAAGMPAADKDSSWIVYTKTAENPDTEQPAVAELQPKVIEFDELTGKPKNTQHSRVVQHEKGKTEQKSKTSLPWRDWMQSSSAETQSRKSCEMGLALAVLHMLHADCVAVKQPIDVEIGEDKKPRVVATRDVEEGTLQLPPCIPKTNKLFDNSVHPYRACITVTRQPTLGQNDAVASKTLYANPEWKAPESVVEQGVTTWKYNDSDFSMHPFWAVRRLTVAQQAKEHLPENCEIITAQYATTTVGTFNDDTISHSHRVNVSVLRNKVPLKQGDELIIHLADKTVSAKRTTETWKTDVAKADKRQKSTTQKCTTSSKEV